MSQIPNRPLHEQLPPPVTSSPGMMQPRAGAVRWYLPSWGERVRYMRWRTLYFVPAVLLIMLLLLAVVATPFALAGVQLLVAWWKLLLIAIALPTAMAIRAARDAIRARPDPFCIHCGYSMAGLPDQHTCPECGEPYDRAVSEEYRRDPHFFIDRHKALGALPRAEHVPFAAGPNRRASRDGT
jgi:hypothetical protein